MFRVLILAFAFWLTASFAQARQSLPLDTGNTEIMLISGADTVTPGQSLTVALKMKFDGDWYTYWRNAGDSGEPVNIVWDLPKGVSAGPIMWPAPEVKTVGPIVSYAMGGEVWLPVKISVDATVNPDRAITLKAHAYFLVCDEICIPEDGALSLPMGLGASKINEVHAAQVTAAKTKIPQAAEAIGSAKLDAGKVLFNVTNLPRNFGDPALFPHANPIIVHSDPVNLALAEDGIRFSANPSYGWDDGTPDSFYATLVSSDGRAIVVPIATDGLVEIGPLKVASASANVGILSAIIGAFLGGLILNLMPCVFPIISLKALSLAKTAHGERGAVRRAAWAYTAGVLVSFAVFAVIIIGLKAAGASVGWGFQLQSPWLVAVLSLLLFAIGLNLLGMFELSGRLQNIGADSVNRAGPLSSFLTGVLAVIVATPCTAPFMAGAVGFALASSFLTTLIVFLALGLGFALPFLLAAYIPGLLSRLPKPGAWMETFRQFLAFPMFAAAIWLAWVLSLQAGTTGILKLLLAGLALGFGIWALGKTGGLSKILGVIALLLSITLPFTLSAEDGAEILKSNAWSAQAVETARAENRPVFVDFTAAWCVTCKVNEALVLNKKKTAQLFDRTDTEFLVADWTNKNDVIAAELKRFGRAGVPLYLVYKPGAAEAEILPQILTHDLLKEALE
ncbi:MAG: thioredoxin family protein [Litorimonas sp.]